MSEVRLRDRLMHVPAKYYKSHFVFYLFEFKIPNPTSFNRCIQRSAFAVLLGPIKQLDVVTKNPFRHRRFDRRLLRQNYSRVFRIKILVECLFFQGSANCGNTFEF